MNLSFDVSFEPLWFATDITQGHSLGSKILKLLTLLLDLFMLFTTKESKLAEREERERECQRVSLRDRSKAATLTTQRRIVTTEMMITAARMGRNMTHQATGSASPTMITRAAGIIGICAYNYS